MGHGSGAAGTVLQGLSLGSTGTSWQGHEITSLHVGCEQKWSLLTAF